MTYHKRGDINTALKFYKQSFEIAQSNNSYDYRRLQRSTLGSLGKVYYALNEYEQALSLLEESLYIARDLNEPIEISRILNNIGAVYLTSGESAIAEIYFREAILILDSLQEKMGDVYRVSMRDTLVTYQFLQQALIAQGKEINALEISENSRAKSFASVISKKINQKLNVDISYFNIEKIQKIAKEQKATIVEYSLITDITQDSQLFIGKSQGVTSKLFAWVIQPTGKVEFREIDISQITSFDDLVKASRFSMGVTERGYGDLANLIEEPQTIKTQQTENLRYLHQILIEPISDLLPKDPSQEVIFIPQGSLFLVPFPALQDTQAHYLIEKHLTTRTKKRERG